MSNLKADFFNFAYACGLEVTEDEDSLTAGYNTKYGTRSIRLDNFGNLVAFETYNGHCDLIIAEPHATTEIIREGFRKIIGEQHD